MRIKIIIKKREVKINLFQAEKLFDEIIFSEANNISEKLLPSIDKILKRHRLSPKEIKRIDLETDLAESYTTYRIAKATADAFNWAVNNVE